MKFCKECGEKITGENKFCKGCGAPIQGSGQASIRKQKKPMPKKQKLWIGGLVAGLIILFGLYKVGAYYTSGERLVGAFREAVEDQDATKVAELLMYQNSDKEVTKEEAEAFLTYIDSSPMEKEFMLSSLTTQLSNYENKKAVAGGMELLKNGVVQLEKHGKTFLFDNYELTIEPVYVSVSTNYADTVIYKGETELVTSDSADFEQQFGPFLPGKHEFKAVYKNDWIELETQETIEVLSGEDTIELELESEEIYFDSELGKSTKGRLFINGKAVNFNPFAGNKFGPAKYDGSMEVTAEAEFPWGTMTSAPVSVTGSEVSVYSFKTSEELKKKIKETMTAFKDGYHTTISTGEKTGENVMTDEMMGTVMLEYENQATYGSDLEWTLSESILLMDYVMVKQKIDGTYILRVYTKDKLLRKSNGEEENVYFYDIIYKDGKWLVDYEYQDFHMDTTNGWENGIKLLNKEKTYTYDGPIVQNVKPKDEQKDKQEDKQDDTDPGDTDSKLKELTAELMANYLYGLTTAINTNDFGSVDHLLLEGSSLYEAQKSLVAGLHDRGITEEVEDFEITDVSKAGSEMRITTSETIAINYGDGTEKVQDYKWVYTAVLVDGAWKLSSISE
ncbi:zinc ribbon domain-containing protein [Thalassobacillus pellis]|uniref:zinc ribbon domain-containing protein n=1 Tax=Thalassobacillus pellis TaxID=748008 RepID=UPI0019600200|nr:hypothetical protein [Thalassobacillus pellis]MBM7551679.1 putative membrane protein YvbJ [Thalassobacillus pellis]